MSWLPGSAFRTEVYRNERYDGLILVESQREWNTQ